MPLQISLDNFRQSIVAANGFISLGFQQDATGAYIHSVQEREFISESAFLRIFIAWESFLESSFLNYLQGHPSILGNVVTCYATPTSEIHAQNLVKGSQRYVNWADNELVRKLSNIFFQVGNPFDTFLAAIATDLSDLKHVRNSAAHLSSTTNSKLDAVSTRKLGTACVNFKVSDLLFAVDPSSPTSETILTSYLTLLDAAAEGISNA